ncbi:TLD-domain-containing protein, partial [Phlyctochytrium arcticum]
SQEHSSLLSVEAAYILRLSLPFESESERMSTWSCVFDSERDGKSWTVFTDRILDVGDVLLIVKDKQNHVFGAFTSNLLPGPSFKESPSSRLFSLSPTMAVYTPTSINKNHVYFNVGAHTLPNGLGFGGQMEYFGLWIGETFEGCSKASPRSTTYDNPMLSGSQDFVIDSIEAWLVKPKEVDDRLIQKRGGKTSVLNTSEAAAMLEMGGHRMYSKEIGE